MAVFKKDIRALSSQFQRCRNQFLCGGLSYADAYLAGAGKGQLTDIRVVQKVLAGFASRACDDIDDAGRQKVFDEFHKDQHTQRSRGRRLKYHAVACRQGRSQFPCGHQERKVPGNDLPYDADGFPENQAHEVSVEDGSGSLHRADRACEIAEVIRGIRNIDSSRFPYRFAVIQSFHPGQKFCVLIDPIGDLHQDRGAGAGFYRFPVRKSFPCRFYRSVHIFFCSLCALGEGLSRSGIF